jgi:hypothetical protein
MAQVVEYLPSMHESQPKKTREGKLEDTLTGPALADKGPSQLWEGCLAWHRVMTWA